VYRLERGEALYSSVVARFTGRIYAEDVNALAKEIAARSAIADVTDIPIGYPVKIPLERLSPEYLPAGHPGREAYERELAESASYANDVRSSNLEGVTVVLDAGHGGRDGGAIIDDVWESTYAYDIVLRVRRLLASTAARTVMTTRDGGEWKVVERDVLGVSRAHAVLPTPPYAIDDSRVSSNLRWYLSNSVFSKAVAGGGDPDKVVFLSVHADSLHPSMRGAMVYIPGLLAVPCPQPPCRRAGLRSGAHRPQSRVPPRSSQREHLAHHPRALRVTTPLARESGAEPTAPCRRRPR
jgi:N-acetylmuramoyl-L-alanine amidase